MAESLPPIVILAGGLATRMMPLTATVPKALLPVAGEPFIAHQLRLLKEQGAGKVILCIGHLGEQIRDFVGSGKQFGLQVRYSEDGPVRLGTGGAIAMALERFPTEELFVTYGDSYLLADLHQIYSTFEDSGKMGQMVVYKNGGSLDKSNVHFADGVLHTYDKRSPSEEMQHIDWGIGVLKSIVFKDVPKNKFTDLSDIYADLSARGALAGYEVQQRFYEVGSREGLSSLDALLSSSKAVGA